jgi:hypothetical protein
LGFFSPSLKLTKMKKQNKKQKIKNGQKNLRLHICFFFYLFFLDDVWPAAPGSIHNNHAGGEVASGPK